MQSHIAESQFGRTSACAPTNAIPFSTGHRCSRHGRHLRLIGSSYPLNNWIVFAQRATSRLNWPRFTPIAKLLWEEYSRDSRFADHELNQRPSTDLRNARSIGCKADCNDRSCACSDGIQLAMFGDGPLAQRCISRRPDQEQLGRATSTPERP